MFQCLLFIVMASTLSNGKVITRRKVFTRRKIYKRCELARELVYNLHVDRSNVADWVCLVHHESNYNTAAIGTSKAGSNRIQAGSNKNHGLFQISDLWWCSEPGSRGNNGCGLSCSVLRDSSIKDDFACANMIYKETRKISGNGFNAWDSWKGNCRGRNLEEYVKGCFEEEDTNTEFRPTKTRSKTTPSSWSTTTPRSRTTPSWWTTETATKRPLNPSRPPTIATIFKCGGLSLECIDIPGNTVYPYQCKWVGKESVSLDGVSFVGDDTGVSLDAEVSFVGDDTGVSLDDGVSFVMNDTEGVLGATKGIDFSDKLKLL